MGVCRNILRYAGEYKNKLYLAIFLIFVSVIAGIIPYLLSYDLIIKFVQGNGITIGYLLLIAGGVAFALWLQSYLHARGLEASHEAAYDTLMGMRKEFANKLTKLPLGDINEKGTGSYKKNFVDDIESVELLIAHMIPEGIPYVIMPVAIYLILFIVDWRLGLLAMASIPIGLLAITMMMKSGLKKMGPYYQSARKMNATIVEYISGMEVIKIFNQTTNSYQKYISAVKDYKEFTLAWVRESWTYMAMYSAVLPCTILLLLPVGTALFVNGTLSLPTFVFSLLLAMSVGLPLVKMVQLIPLVPNLKYKIEQLEKTFAGEELKTIDRGAEPESYDVDFKNVRFAYDKQDVIKDISFAAKENTVTAIVGESGSGKSTLAKLLVHFWDVQKGEIAIGGVNIREISVARLMDLISYVAQDTFLFNMSIMENIRVGRPSATDEEVMAAAKLAMCHDFIVNMPNGYQTNAGEAGDKLSGGEKQRITIARAILKNAPIIVLDEATAFTDPENEDRIQEAINELVVGKTLIVIAHRLSTIVEANNIILLEQGRLAMQGSHAELLAKSETYQALWDSHQRSLNWDITVRGVENA